MNHPAEYRWSSYRVNAQDESFTFLTAHPLYMAFGADDAARRHAYRELFRYPLNPGMVDEIRAATNSNYVLGSSRLQEQIASTLGRRVTCGQSGRPRNRREPESGGLFKND